jgi:hypothetical protein
MRQTAAFAPKKTSGEKLGEHNTCIIGGGHITVMSCG